MFGLSSISEVLNNTDYEIFIGYQYPCPQCDVILCVDLQDKYTQLDTFQKAESGIFLPPRSRTFLYDTEIPHNQTDQVDDCVMAFFILNNQKLILPIFSFWQHDSTIYTGCTYIATEYKIIVEQPITKAHSFTLFLNQKDSDGAIESIIQPRNSKDFYVNFEAMKIGLLINDGEQTYQAYESPI